jgi:hypothetical protein
MSDQIVLPESPKSGNIVEWWSMQHHPVEPYVQRHSATYYEDAPCSVIDEFCAGGVPLHDEWHCETWYEPSGKKTSGGRCTTEGLRRYLTVGPASGSVHLTWEGARGAAVAAMRERAHEFKSIAMRLERAAMALAELPTPKACAGDIQ